MVVKQARCAQSTSCMRASTVPSIKNNCFIIQPKCLKVKADVQIPTEWKRTFKMARIAKSSFACRADRSSLLLSNMA